MTGKKLTWMKKGYMTYKMKKLHEVQDKFCLRCLSSKKLNFRMIDSLIKTIGSTLRFTTSREMNPMHLCNIYKRYLLDETSFIKIPT